jgi:hypothetical protein
MPRKAPKEVIEHRLTLGDYERKQLEQTVNAYQVDKALENVPNILLGAGVLLAGGGLALGGYSAWVWLTGDKFIDKIRNATFDGLDNVFGTLFEASAGYDPIEHIRDRQDLRREFNTVIADIDQYCSTGSRNYDEGKCQVAYARREELIVRREQLEAKQQEEKDQAKQSGDYGLGDNPVEWLTYPFRFYGNLLGLNDD